jgi:hypothetical protein
VDLVAVSLRGLLDPKELRVANPSEMAQLLGRLGPLSANLGIAALGNASEAALLAAQFNDAAESNFGERHYDILKIGSSETRIPRPRELTDEQITSIRRAMVENLREASHAFEDAVRQTPEWHTGEPMKFIAEPTSRIGVETKAHLASQEPAHPTRLQSLWDSLHRRILTRIGR